MLRIRLLRSGALILVLGGALSVLSGCPSGNVPSAAPSKPFKGVEIAVAGLGDSALIEAVDSQRGEWEESRGARANIGTRAVKIDSLGNADVILFPGDQLGALVDAGALAVLPESLAKPPAIPKDQQASGTQPPEDLLAFADVVQPYRESVTKYGPDRMGLPLGASALVVVYRRDVFESDVNRKAAQESGVAFSPPKTWEEFDALAKFLNGRDWDDDGEPESGVAFAFADDTEGIGNTIFLARAAALGLHKDQFGLLFDSDDLTPRIDSPPFVEALRGLVALKAFGPPKVETFDAEAAREAFRLGRVALLIDRAERAARWNNPKSPFPIGLAPLPGSKRVFNPETKVWEEASPPNRPSFLPSGGGWLVGLSASAKGPKKDAALDFLTYLASPEASSRLLADRAFPMLPVRSSQAASGPSDARAIPGLDAKSWSDSIASVGTASQVVVGLRIPDSVGYLSDLSKARASALAGQSAETVLSVAANAWKDRSKTLGHERQLWHYRRSLNRLSTSAKPPPK
jgi:multiple sugar transport system substrate-binding protein